MADSENKIADFTLDDLYFGSVVVYFSNVNGSVHHANDFQTDFAEDSKAEATARRTPEFCSKLGSEYSNLILPAPPAMNIIPQEVLHDLPDALAHPLLKTKTGSLQGIASGVRSALVKSGDIWFRLKGCGNNADGFLVEPVENQNDLLNVRGSNFLHTCIREAHYSTLVCSLLEPIAIPCANTPRGWYTYKLHDDPIPKIVKTCGIFETLGNRRLGNNVLRGLEMLLPLLVGEVDGDHLNKHLDSSRTSDELIPTSLAYICGLPLASTAQIPLVSEVPKIPQDCDVRWHKLWKANMSTIQDFLSSSDSDLQQSLFPYVFARLGDQAGRIHGTLANSKVCWGSYTDLMGSHCNAHANNYVLLPETSCKGHAIIAPCDFDLAFTEETFVPYNDSDNWERLMELELNGNVMSLGGDADISTGVSGGAKLSGKLKVVQTLLRDILVTNFLKVFHIPKECEMKLLPNLEPVLHSLLRLACILTATDVA